MMRRRYSSGPRRKIKMGAVALPKICNNFNVEKTKMRFWIRLSSVISGTYFAPTLSLASGSTY